MPLVRRKTGAGIPAATLALGLASLALGRGPAAAATWTDATAATIGTTSEWSNKVELADLDGDGDLDILFANGGDYATPGTPERLRTFRNDGGGGFTEITTEVFGEARFFARAVKVADVTGDGVADIVIGATYHTRSRLFVGGPGGFADRTAELPDEMLSVGDLELGDVDDDGDLDVVLADWGIGNPLGNDGGQPRLWLNDGAGRFTDATDARMPVIRVGMSWDLELVDVDNDRDLDVLISSKTSAGGVLLRNADGNFSDASDALPRFTNDYEFEAIDLDGDRRLDLVTINDGPDLTEHVFRGDGVGFTDATAMWWPAAANPAGVDDNAAVFCDADGDGDADVLIGSLNGDDRVLVNDGAGHLAAGPQIFPATASPGTLGVAVGDLDGDGRLDLVESQGEAASRDLVFLGEDIPIDDDPPSVVEVAPVDRFTGPPTIVARITDLHTPTRPSELQSVDVVYTAAGGEVGRRAAMAWYGEALFRARLDYSPQLTVQVCATDLRGNQACTPPRTMLGDGFADDAGPGAPDAGAARAVGGDGGCGCHTGGGGSALGAVAALALAAALGRRRSR